VSKAPSIDPSLAVDREAVENALDRLLPGETTPPPDLHRGMRYAVFAGGKRLRPLLMLAGCRACGGTIEEAVPAAAAVEMIHTYSLVHDDLPAMDDDSLRRGKPTTHVVFGEAMAILVGDALLTRAVEVLTDGTDSPLPPSRRLAVLGTLAAAAGSTSMAGGQALDLQAEGRKLDLAAVEDLHRRKTGALIEASVVAGGQCAGAGEDSLRALRRYGAAIGLAFQIVDDILDVTGSTDELGKSAGKDEQAGKATFPALLGLEASRARAHELADQALDSLREFGPEAGSLRGLVHALTRRES
jgi:geranylgeranyl diphosphate synthase type II